MNYDLITTKEFEDGMATLLQEISQVKSIVTKLQENNVKDEWLTLEHLIEYLPGSVKPRQSMTGSTNEKSHSTNAVTPYSFSRAK